MRTTPLPLVAVLAACSGGKDTATTDEVAPMIPPMDYTAPMPPMTMPPMTTPPMPYVTETGDTGDTGATASVRSAPIGLSPLPADETEPR